MRSPSLALLWALWRKNQSAVVYVFGLFALVLVLKGVASHQEALARAARQLDFDRVEWVAARAYLILSSCILGLAVVVVGVQVACSWQNSTGNSSPLPRWVVTLPAGHCLLSLLPLFGSALWFILWFIIASFMDDSLDGFRLPRSLLWVVPLAGLIGWRSGLRLAFIKGKWLHLAFGCALLVAAAFGIRLALEDYLFGLGASIETPWWRYCGLPFLGVAVACLGTLIQMVAFTKRRWLYVVLGGVLLVTATLGVELALDNYHFGLWREDRCGPRFTLLWWRYGGLPILGVFVACLGILVQAVAFRAARSGGSGFLLGRSTLFATQKPFQEAGPAFLEKWDAGRRFGSPFRAYLWLEWRVNGRAAFFWGLAVVLSSLALLWFETGGLRRGATNPENFPTGAFLNLSLLGYFWLVLTGCGFFRDPASCRFPLSSFSATLPLRIVPQLLAKTACLYGVVGGVALAGIIGWHVLHFPKGSVAEAQRALPPSVAAIWLQSWFLGLVPIVGPLALAGRCSSRRSALLLSFLVSFLLPSFVLTAWTDYPWLGRTVIPLVLLGKIFAAGWLARKSVREGLAGWGYFAGVALVWGIAAQVLCVLWTSPAVHNAVIGGSYFGVILMANIPLLRFAAAPLALQRNRVH